MDRGGKEGLGVEWVGWEVRVLLPSSHLEEKGEGERSASWPRPWRAVLEILCVCSSGNSIDDIP